MSNALLLRAAGQADNRKEFHRQIGVVKEYGNSTVSD